MDYTSICIAFVSEKSGVIVWISFVFWCLVGTSYRCLSLLRLLHFVLTLSLTLVTLYEFPFCHISHRVFHIHFDFGIVMIDV